MPNRREFIKGSLSLLPSSLTFCVAGAQSTSERSDFVCGTVDRNPAVNSSIQIERYSIDANVDRGALDVAVREFGITPYGTINFVHRWRRGDGLTPNTGMITLGIHFLNGSDTQKAFVQNAANNWLTGELGSRIEFRFGVSRNQAQVTISFNGTGNNSSVVGRESAQYAQTHATMNISDLFDHVVQHEFGHALGLQHEHQHPGAGIEWNKPVVIADMERQGWTQDMVEQNIFARYSGNYACLGDPRPDPNSMMLYPIPLRWTLNGFTSGTNSLVSRGDRRCLEGIYRG
jgi:serralysin